MNSRHVGVLLVSFLWLLSASIACATSYTLTLVSTGSGNIGENPTNSTSTFPQGATITVTASPAAGWYFFNWSGDTNGSVNPLNVTMESALVITGNFLPYSTYTLTLVTNGQGTIGLNPSGGSYDSNTVVTATATPITGWVFTGWSNATNTAVNPVSLALDASVSLAGTFAELPKFDTQPAGVTNVAGSTVSFSALAEGALPLGYQWYFSGGSLGVATNTTLSLTNVSSGQQGNYFVIVTNNYGSATSYVASLTLTNTAGSTNVVTTPTEAGLLTAIQSGGWIGLNFNGTVTLTNTITITNNVILDGSGVAVTISGGNAVQLFTVALGASLTLSNLTLANGECVVTNGAPGTPADGGGIYNNGSVTLDGCTVTNNSAQSLIFGGLARGGAIFNNGGTVLLNQSAISNNAVIGGGPNSSTTAQTVGISLGGAIYNTNGAITIIGCNVSSNLSKSVCEAPLISNNGPDGLSMGGAIYLASGSLTVANSFFASNLSLGGVDPIMDIGVASPAYGGAIAVMNGNFSINSSQFSGNQVGGGNAISHGTAAPAFGGAVYSGSSGTVADSTFYGNQVIGGNNSYNFGVSGFQGTNSGNGGAIYNAGTLALNRCSIYSNYVQGGSASAYTDSEALGGNGLGGGIFNASQLAATNCTIALNSAIGGAGSGWIYGPYINGYSGTALGGGVFNNTSATLIAMNDTIASNTCSSPAGGYMSGYTNGFAAGAEIANTNGTLALHNSIIAYSGTNSNAYGTITDNGYNISDDGSANFSSGSSFNNTNPQLAPVGNYGGPTLCMALLSVSPAIDWGDTHDFPNVDQRGYLRPIGGVPDAGAYEYGSSQAFNPDLNVLPVQGNLILSFTAVPSHTYYFQASPNLTSWINLNTNGPFGTSTNITEVINEQPAESQFFRLFVQ
ncbi:MAG TPA: choice-of-anchor Q domain-containing protein [Verrucomicrobiae bacterium]|jgi:hypothetical protein